MMIRLCVILGMAVLGSVLSPGPGLKQPMASERSPLFVKQTSEQTVTTDVETQKAVDAWAAEEKELLEKIDQQERELKRVEWESKKTAEYLSTLEGKIAELREKAEEMKRINAELLPILDQSLEQLTVFVEKDIPFEKTRRFQKVEETAHILGDYDAGLLVKTRAFFDAMAREVDFGYSVDVKETEIDIEGRSTRVKLLKVGRIGLYALSLDGDRAYEWHPEKATYIQVSGSPRHLDEAVQIVERIRMIELSRLPMGRPAARAASEADRHE